MYLEQKSEYRKNIDYSEVIKNNLLEYKESLGNHRENKSIDNLDCEIDLSDNIIKENYKKYLFKNIDNSDAWLCMQYWHTLYSGVSFDKIEFFTLTGYINKNYEKLNLLFIEALIEYTSELWEPEKKEFLINFYDVFLSYHPNALSLLPLKYKFIILNKVLKRNDLKSISNNLLWDFNYEITFLQKDDIDDLFEIIEDLWNIFWLNSINLLYKSIWVDWGYAEEQLYQNVKYLCELISKKYDNQFFKYKVKNIYNLLNRGYHINQEEFKKVSSDFNSSVSPEGYSYWITKINDDEKESLKSYQEVLNSSDINIFQNESITDLSILIEELHSPEMIYEINKDLWIDITNITLQNQIHLIRFLWNKSTKEFDYFKTTLNSITNESDKYNFLNNFLACSEDIWFWDIILKIANTSGISSDNKNNIYLKYANSTKKIDELSKSIFNHYKGILDKAQRETILSEQKIKKSLISYAWGLFEDIDSKLNDNNQIIDIEHIFEKFDRFDLEMIGIFKIIESLNISEIEKLTLEKIPNLKFNVYDTISLEKNKKSDQIKHILLNRFWFNDFEAFNNDFLKDTSAKVHTLETDEKVLYMVGSRDMKLDNKVVKYIDWLSNNPDLEWFNLKLTQNFLENEFAFWELSQESFEALGEPHTLTSYLFIEKLWFIANWTSDTPESQNYWNPWKYLRLQKDPDDSFISKWKNIEELNSLSAKNNIEIIDFSIPRESDKLIDFVNEKQQNWFIMTRMILKSKNDKDKLYSCVFEQIAK